MHRKRLLHTLGLPLIAGLVGGALAARFLSVGPQAAQAAAKPAGLIEAEEFRLVEKDGKPCGRFQVDKSGRPALLLYDKHGEVRAVVGVMPDGTPHVALSDKDGRVRAVLAVWPDQRPSLALSDTDGTPRATLAVPSDLGPSLSLADKQGNPRAILGSPSVEMIREFRNRDESSLALLNREGKLLWSAP